MEISNVKLVKPLGPLVMMAELPETVVKTHKEIVDVIKDKKEMGYRHASQIKTESEIPHSMLEQKNVMNVLHTVGKSYVAQAYLNAGKKDLHDAVNITTQMRSIWSVSQYENEYNPSHKHTGCEISGVIYLKTPDIKNRRKIPSKEGKRDNDGDIAFPYSSECQRNGELLSKGIMQVTPSRGLMLLFPSWLLHQVYPFIGKDERRSIAFNANYKVGIEHDDGYHEWLGGNETNLKLEYTYWDKTKIKGETK